MISINGPSCHKQSKYVSFFLKTQPREHHIHQAVFLASSKRCGANFFSRIHSFLVSPQTVNWLHTYMLCSTYILLLRENNETSKTAKQELNKDFKGKKVIMNWYHCPIQKRKYLLKTYQSTVSFLHTYGSRSRVSNFLYSSYQTDAFQFDFCVPPSFLLHLSRC